MKSGKIIGGYRLVEPLGRGGMGEVWTVEASESCRRVVLKCIPSAGLDAEQAQSLRDRLHREAHVMEQLDHEGIARAIEHFEDRGEVYLVLEYIPGVTMRRWLASEPEPPLADRLLVIHQIALALAHAHDAGVIHRDLKPTNVMVGPGPNAKVLDFGLARALDSTRLTRTGMVMGTLCYMAPEQALGQTVDQRADLYSLGMMLALSLGLRGPFRDSGRSEMYRRLVSPEPVELDDWLPDDISVGLETLLEKNRALRWDSAVEAIPFIEGLREEGETLERRLREARESAARAAPPKLGSMRRRECLTALDELRARLASGQGGGCLLMLAPPGGGRTEALAQCLDRVRAAGVATAQLAFVSNDEDGTVLWDFVDTSAATLGSEPPSTALLPDDPGDQLITQVEKRCELGALALAVDDVHYATRRELDLVERLLGLTESRPLLLLVAGDAAAEGAGPRRAEAYAAFMTHLATSDRCRRVVLEPVPERAVVADLASRGVPEDVARRVWQLAGGNPGLMHCLLEQWHSGKPLDDVSSEGPAPLVRRLRERFEQLGDRAVNVLAALVNLGGGTELGSLVEASGLPRLAVQACLRDMSKKHGWIRMEGQQVMLTQPFLGAVLREHED